MTTYRGGCHCGRIQFDAEGELKKVMECNCSICARKGSLLWFIPRDRFTLRTSETDAATYTFNKNLIKHRFCPTCGIHPFAYGIDQKGSKMAAVNVRCLENVDLGRLEIQKFDGRSL